MKTDKKAATKVKEEKSPEAREYPIVAARWAKNDNEEFRIVLDRHKGHDMLSIRVWYRDKNQIFKPGRHGINFKIEHLSQVRRGLKECRTILRTP